MVKRQQILESYIWLVLLNIFILTVPFSLPVIIEEKIFEETHKWNFIYNETEKNSACRYTQHTKSMINSMHVDLKFDIINENLDPDCSNF